MLNASKSTTNPPFLTSNHGKEDGEGEVLVAGVSLAEVELLRLALDQVRVRELEELAYGLQDSWKMTRKIMCFTSFFLSCVCFHAKFACYEYVIMYVFLQLS